MGRRWVAVWLFLGGGMLGKAEDKDLAALDGTWAIVSSTDNGVEVMPERLMGVEFVVKAGKVSARLDGKEVSTSTITIDASRTPKHLDLIYESGAAKGKTTKAIYKLDGDTLTWCEAPPGVDGRPTAFESKTGSGFTLFTLQRQKGGK
jgi:uncharacterized protein (TIGR03067 family)